MKNLILPVLLICSLYMSSQTPCIDGTAGGFSCEGLDLISQIPLSTMGSNRANDSWGWTDPSDGKEYAIICLNEGTAFIDISDPLNPVYLGTLPTEGSSSTWRDAKTYNNHAFIVSEDPGHGMQVFDLTRLRNVNNPPVTFTNDVHFTGFGSAHNIVINEDTGYAYAVGTDLFSGGAYFIDIQDPLNPQAAGGYSGEGYTHDAHVVNYNGPDTDYSGQEIMVGSNEDELVIVDVSNKANPIPISSISYTNVAYTHQGWFTEDQRFFLLGDEADEIDFGINSRTIVIDLLDLDNPQVHFSYSGPTGATDHNGYVKGDRFYLANNAAGLRVIDISDLENQNMTEVGHFDTYSVNNNSGFNGSWSVYPYFDSGHIVISDREEGFVLVKESGNLNSQEFDPSEFALVPNPAEDLFTISAISSSLEKIAITDVLGKTIYSEVINGLQSTTIDVSNLSEGIYFVRINDNTTKKLRKN
ncbi:MAG: choice-of-anchor B family protein [Bacteroidia bacterium]|nr:choice-of-anchor B family protein [Bacteroidia bacterium]MBT8275718.1 choice-of-anchor B family protein [Bacteroidia bacterium]NNF30928.1 choice-of-anchor B family protein [Flavobacteriaceae bacterium]NNM09567.1 choice-of-anchor B family protein [Flavobacteriaceae bacterium]